MKNFALLTLFVFLLPSSLLAGHPIDHAATGRANSMLRFVAKIHGLRQFALKVVMEERCFKYLPGPEARACTESSDKTIELLDFDLLMNDQLQPSLLNEDDPESFVFVAFRKEFLNLMDDAQTEKYLHFVNEKLNRFLAGEDRTPANLWDLSVAHFGSQKTAARMLAVLFQDTSPQKLHLAWFDKKNVRGTLQMQNNKDLLHRVIDTINFIMDTTESHYRTIFYPKNVLTMLNRNIYHFYVPLYLSQSLVEKGLKSEEAVLGPLMLTLTYEFITSANDFRYVFKDPKTLADQTMLDIFAGYAGGRMGAGIHFESSEMIMNKFKSSTHSGVQALLPY